ncbi:conjugal transfer pilus assembly protein TraI [Cupriavidus sp. YR651]|uniref:TraI domain-containing protein n=1 Tax=Cupriavidus sp. YR651 TaxID=1855315 RepID=UPI000882ADF1|nr:TraI domain-containing protein [Cupriavidus sp. YR651]SDD56983.1 conjugal transfer pilus assembly protein TraI [Cupriavidus sp. YR651]
MKHQPLNVAESMRAHSSRVDLIRQYANESDRSIFDAKWLGVVESCASWFSSMPLRPLEHAEPGGAFRATVEAAYFAMRLSGAQKFAADQPSERRRLLEPQYLYALFLAACCSRLDEPCRHFRFHRDSDGNEWIPAAHGAFGAWLGNATYTVTRREEAAPVERMRTALLAREILGAERLAQFDSVVLTDLFGAINPDPRPSGLETLLHKVARQAIDTVTQFEVKARRAAFAPDSTAPPSATALSDSMAPSSGASGSAVPAPASTVSQQAVGASEAAPAAASASSPAAPPTSASTGVESEIARPAVVQLDPNRPVRQEPPKDPFAEALAGTSNLMRDFFRALAQDVAAGKAKVSWVDGKLAIGKRMIGNYGIASETLIENLRKFNLLYKVVGQDILLVEKVSVLVAERPAGSEGA